MTPERLKELLSEEPAYRRKQAATAIYKKGAPSFDAITTLPAALRAKLKDEPILSFEVQGVEVSRDRRAHKAVVKLRDGKRVETVLMSPKPGLWTTCISSQVGCAMACTFCATGLMGFTRNLSAEEISDQVLFWKQYIAEKRAGSRLDNVVYMGMGEPMLNMKNLLESLRALSDPAQFGIGARHLSVSTVGIVPGIDKLAEAFPQANLALSLHSARPGVRSRIAPINRQYPLESLRDALKAYFDVTRRKVFIEYVMLHGENDRPQDAEALVAFLKSCGARQLLHVNLIVFNPTDTPHEASPPHRAKRFAGLLRKEGFAVTFRKNLGQDIQGACGQLVLREKKGRKK